MVSESVLVELSGSGSGELESPESVLAELAEPGSLESVLVGSSKPGAWELVSSEPVWWLKVFDLQVGRATEQEPA